MEQIHSTTIATIGSDGYPQTRIIDMMLYDENGIYFITELDDNSMAIDVMINTQYFNFHKSHCNLLTIFLLYKIFYQSIFLSLFS